MEKTIILNHKMNLEYNQIENYIKQIKKLKLNPIVFPTAIYATKFIENNIKTGLQNIYQENSGPYTGEISPKQAKSLGISYVLIGHHERREIFKETNQDINKKIKQSLQNNLKVILCVGEKKEEDYKQTIKKQIEEGLKDIKEEIIIAYEPAWSIGQKQIPNPKQIEKIIKYIKSLFKYDIIVMYGGSVDSKTIKQLNKIKEISGFLIGKQSTNYEELKKIKEVVS